MRLPPLPLKILIILPWGLAVLVALFSRPPLPVDETRYLAVAWDMWREGHYLVPHLNGDPYSHKPPMLFWLMTAGWHLFGVNEWWPRLVAPVFGLGTVFMSMRLARILWPDRPEIPVTTAFILTGTLFWCLFTTLTMFDMVLAFFAVAALASLVFTARTGHWAGFLLTGALIGLGVLAKGPAILLHYLPVAISAPWWAVYLSGSDNTVLWSWTRWYTGVASSILCAVAIGLSWAIPAGIEGGEAYRDAIFWGQSAGRIVNSFAHARPFWWYLAVLPILVLPWFLWPPLWRGFRLLFKGPVDGAQRFCVIWFTSAFFVFSLVNGKQAHYLLPEFPALAILAAYIVKDQGVKRRIDSFLPGSFLILLAVIILISPSLPLTGRISETIADVNNYGALLMLVSGIAVILYRTHAMGICFATSASVVSIHLIAAPVLSTRYDLSPISNEIKMHQKAGKAVANFGKYHGQYHFLGRLISPLSVIGQVQDDEQHFLREHPDGIVVAYHKELPGGIKPISMHNYRHMTVTIWPAQALIDNPGIAERR